MTGEPITDPAAKGMRSLLEPAAPPNSIEVSSDLVMLADPTGEAAEAIRQLRTRLVAQHLTNGRRALALCSPTENSGCSFIASNLAIAFAQAEVRVLLLNADLRNGGFDRYFGSLGAQSGLLQYLSGENVVSYQLGYEVIPGLRILPSGGTTSEAQELLAATRFSEILNKSVREFDLTIIDTPPANLYADAQQIARAAGYCAVVARSHATYFADVSEFCSQLRADGATVVGSILNQY